MEGNTCMKCGRERPEDQVFCDKCLADMRQHPVKPGVVVLLPKREDHQPKPAPKRRHPVLPPEEQIRLLKKRVMGLTLAVLIFFGATVGLGWLVVQDWIQDHREAPKPGQNYTSEVHQEPVRIR